MEDPRFRPCLFPAAPVALMCLFLTLSCGERRPEAPPPSPSVPSPASAVPAPAGSPPEWRASLAEVTMPSGPVSGTLGGEPFVATRGEYSEFVKVLTLGQGEGFFPEREVKVFLFLKDEEQPDGKDWHIPGEDGAAPVPYVQMGRMEGEESSPTYRMFTEDYALRLQFGRRAEERLPGKIYLCLPDEDKSVVAGTFSVTLK